MEGRALIYPYKNNRSTERKFRGKVVKHKNKYMPCFNQWTRCHKIYKYQNTKYSVLSHVNLYPYIGNKHFYSYIWRNKTIEELETYSFQESSNYQWFEFSRLFMLWPASLLRNIFHFVLKCWEVAAIRYSSWSQISHCCIGSKTPFLFSNGHKSRTSTELETWFQIINFSTLRIKF